MQHKPKLSVTHTHTYYLGIYICTIHHHNGNLHSQPLPSQGVYTWLMNIYTQAIIPGWLLFHSSLSGVLMVGCPSGSLTSSCFSWKATVPASCLCEWPEAPILYSWPRPGSLESQGVPLPMGGYSSRLPAGTLYHTGHSLIPLVYSLITVLIPRWGN